MTSEKENLLGILQELEDESRLLTTKIQDIKIFVDGLEFKEATLFDHVTPPIPTAEIPVTDTTEEKPRRTRVRAKDGTMTASTMAHALSRELGRTISKDSIVRVAKQIKVKPTYCERQHTSRYSADAVQTIMNLYRSFNQL